MADVTMMKTPAETALADRFAALRGSLPGDAVRREEAFSRFAEKGLPHRRLEEWHYTDLRALMREAAPPAARPDEAATVAGFNMGRVLRDLDAVRLTIVNGYLVPGLSDVDTLPGGIEIVPLAQALASGHPLLAQLGAVEAAHGNAVYALNAAFMTDGAVIRIAAGSTVTAPIHLSFLNTGATPFSTASRVLVVVEEGASATVIESHEGPDRVAYQPNDVLEVIAGDRSTVNLVRLNAEGTAALALSTLTLRLGAEVAFSAINVVRGAAVSRHQVFAAFAGEGTKVNINGAAMLDARQHADTTLHVDHAVPGCDSKELFKTVIDGEATGVFQGKIIVRPHAQKTDGRMMSASLLLSDGATMNNKPELEIFADDVQCAHGATCGALDEELLFYLKSRGLPQAEAESLLIQAFLGEAIETVEHEGVRDALVGIVEAWLRTRA